VGDVVNLRHARKARARDDAANSGAENRLKFGEPSQLKAARKTAERMRDAQLDGARLDPVDGDGRPASR